MATTSPNEQYVQEFRLHLTANDHIPPSAHGAVAIPARKDTKTEDHVVLLSDIQLVYNSTNHILNDGTTVPFVKDDRNQELIPLRIKYYPGVVLEVVADKGQGVGADKMLTTNLSSGSVQEVGNSFLSHGHGVEIAATAADSLSQHKDEHSDTTASTLEAPSPLLTIIRDYGSCFNDMLSSQTPKATSIRNIMVNLLHTMQQEISDNRTFHDRFQGIRQQVGDLRQQTQYDMQHTIEKSIVKSQEEVLILQQRTIDRLVTIQDSAQDIATCAFLAQKHPIPRLFVVLPKPEATQYYSSRPSQENFLLFFICECSSKGGTEGATTVPPRIHFARHKGYDLGVGKAFFDDYGDYVQAIIYILKNGINAPGINIPSMSYLTLADGIDELQESLDLESVSIQSLMDVTSRANLDWNKSAAGDKDRAALNIIETTDLRPLVKYLKGYEGHDQHMGYGLGNLRQYFTPDDDVKWVCDDHYPEDHREIIEEQRELDIVREDLEDPLEEAGPLPETGKHLINVDQAILRDLRDPSWMVREKAVIALNVPAPLSEEALRVLVERAIQDYPLSVSETAIRVLGEQAKLSDMALRELTRITQNSIHITGVVFEVLNAIARSDSGIQRLIELLQDQDSDIRKTVVRVLGEQSGTSQAALEALAGAVRDKNADVSEAATKVLEIQATLPEAAIRTLTEESAQACYNALADPDED
ncbi:hypothetical protein BGZ65_004670, partial [Modicella reniformis]